jgi:hypothetical protein
MSVSRGPNDSVLPGGEPSQVAPGAHDVVLRNLCAATVSHGLQTISRGVRHADESIDAVCRHSPPSLRVLELGAGTASKTSLLLTAATHRYTEVVYMPIDVSQDALETACERIGSLLPRVQLDPLVLNYVTSPPELDRFMGPPTSTRR